MEKRILIDGVKYFYYSPKSEDELEKILKEHVEKVFGESSVFFSKKKLISSSNINSIPDGFVINFRQKKFYIVEVERAEHTYDHFIHQFSKFRVGFENTRNKIVRGMRKQINESPLIKLKVKNAIGKDEEISAFIDEVTPFTNPQIIIVIEEKTSDLKAACENQNIPPSQILELKTFIREGIGNLKVHAHYFDSLSFVETTQEVLIETRKNMVRGGRRLKKGLKTPRDKYCLPILKILIDLGGESRTEEVLKRVKKEMTLKDIDFEMLPSGQSARWENTARWAKFGLRKKGYLDKSSPRGIWRITEKGREYHQKNK